jgi:hypothetical protein
MRSILLRMGESATVFPSWGSRADFLISVPTNVHVFPGLPHGFRRYKDKLSECKRWDEVMSNGISWALSNPASGPFVIKTE